MNGMRKFAKILFPATHEEDLEKFDAVVEEAYKNNDGEFGIAAAKQWYKTQGKPMWGEQAEIMQAEHEKFITEHEYSLKEAGRAYLEPTADERFSLKGIETLNDKNPYKPKLRLLAKGMPVTTPPGFKRNGTTVWPAMRKKYLQVHETVNRTLFDAYVKTGTAFLVSKEFALQHLQEQLHISPLGFALKFGKPQGRPTMDPGDGGPDAMGLNGKEQKERADAYWGSISLPMVSDIAAMIFDFAKENNMDDWDELEVLVMDIANAFALLMVDPEDTGLMASETADGKVIIFLVATLGWCGTPASFNVISKAIIWEINHRLKGKGLSEIYVDDSTTVTTSKNAKFCQGIITSVITGLLGPNSVATTKTVVTSKTIREIVSIGYIFDLRKKRVGVAKKNILKAIYGFFTVDTEVPIPVRHLERLASFACRYSTITEILKPFTSELYRMMWGRNRHASVKWTEEGKLCVFIFRAILILTYLRPDQAVRTMQSFGKATISHVIEFDASLKRAGAFVFEKNADKETLVGGTAVSLLEWKCGVDASYQNTVEFFGGAVVGVILLKEIIGKDKIGTIGLRGDSVSAITWAKKGKVKSRLASNSCAMLALISFVWDVRITESTFIDHDSNCAADVLSREEDIEKSWAKVLELDPKRFGELPDVWRELNLNPWLKLCDPSRAVNNEESFTAWWKEAWKLLERKA